MSGRLIISGKKSYTPWNQKNVERVLRDERLAKEKGHTEAKQKRQREGNLRISNLKKFKSGDDVSSFLKDDNTSCPQHFNLFEKEELAHKCILSVSNDEKKTHDILPNYLVAKDNGIHSQTEFYKRSTHVRLDLDEKIKDSLDPMREFCRDRISTENSQATNTMKSNSIHVLGRDQHEPKYSSKTELWRRQIERQKKYSLKEKELRHKV